MNSSHPRLPTLVDLPAGPMAVPILGEQLSHAVENSEVVIAALPMLGPQVSEALRSRLIDAIAPGEPLAHSDGQVLLTTSGSTGTAKAVVHSIAAVRHAAEALHERLGGPGHWLCALPLHTSAGFMTVARAVLSGTRAVATASLGGAEPFTADNFLAACEQIPTSGRRYTSMVPAMASRLAEHPDALAALATFDAVLLGGQAIPSELITTLSGAGVNVVLSYGATETCGGCVYDGQPLRDVTVSIADDGRVVICGPPVMLGYRHMPAAMPPNVEQSVGSAGVQRCVTMPDLGRIDDQGRLHINGRVDDVVIVNGINVSISAVETVLRDLGLATVVCSGNDQLFAVTAVGISPDESDAAVARIHEQFGIRVRMRVLRDVPVTAAGKPDRSALAAQLS